MAVAVAVAGGRGGAREDGVLDAVGSGTLGSAQEEMNGNSSSIIKCRIFVACLLGRYGLMDAAHVGLILAHSSLLTIEN